MKIYVFKSPRILKPVLRKLFGKSKPEGNKTKQHPKGA